MIFFYFAFRLVFKENCFCCGVSPGWFPGLDSLIEDRFGFVTKFAETAGDVEAVLICRRDSVQAKIGPNIKIFVFYKSRKLDKYTWLTINCHSFCLNRVLRLNLPKR